MVIVIYTLHVKHLETMHETISSGIAKALGRLGLPISLIFGEFFLAEAQPQLKRSG